MREREKREGRGGEESGEEGRGGDLDRLLPICAPSGNQT